ncbi:unnamed protein product, partial [Dibothriocephalus latus]
MSKFTQMSQLAAPPTTAPFPRSASAAADVGAATDEEAGADFELDSVLARCLPSHPSPAQPPPAAIISTSIGGSITSSHDSSGQPTKLPFSPAATQHQHHL